jgi:flagellar assembly factor FliW
MSTTQSTRKVDGKTAELEERVSTKVSTANDTMIRFDEGLIGLAECKYFALGSINNVKPFRLLECTGPRQISFVVLDPTVRVPDYYQQIPDREWEAVGATNPKSRLALAIVNLGLNAHDSSANLQAPILVNLETMAGRQVILTDSGFCVRTPLVG